MSLVKTNNLEKWQTVGVHASENQKNDLLEHIIKSTFNPNIPIDKIVDSWLVIQNLINIKYMSLCFNIKGMCPGVNIYISINDNKVEEILITSKDYKEEYLDKITDIVLEYEKNMKIEINYYYVKESNVLKKPSGAIKI